MINNQYPLFGGAVAYNRRAMRRGCRRALKAAQGRAVRVWLWTVVAASAAKVLFDLIA